MITLDGSCFANLFALFKKIFILLFEVLEISWRVRSTNAFKGHKATREYVPKMMGLNHRQQTLSVL